MVTIIISKCWILFVTANAAEEAMKPYFTDILELFKAYLTNSSEDEQVKKLQVAAIGK